MPIRIPKSNCPQIPTPTPIHQHLSMVPLHSSQISNHRIVAHPLLAPHRLAKPPKVADIFTVFMDLSPKT
jgi:hypothetical protein